MTLPVAQAGVDRRPEGTLNDRRAGPAAEIGVVVAARDAERYLAATLRSLSGQTWDRWIAIVVDDGSDDATASIALDAARHDGRISVLRQGNAGVSAARNAGVAALPPAVRSVCFVDSDDLLCGDGLAVLGAALAHRPDAVAATGWADTIDGDGRPVAPGEHRATQSDRMIGAGLRVRTLGPGEDTSFASLVVHGTIWPPATALVRRDVVNAIGGFDEGLTSQEDWDLWLRASRLGPIAFVDHQVAWYRRHDGNATHDRAGNQHAARVVRRKAWLDPGNTAAGRRRILGANVRLLVWDLGMDTKAGVEALRRGERRIAARRARRALHLLGQLARVTPVVPSRATVETMVALADDGAVR